jgi:xanthine dehydrogenase accessory factor
MKEIKSIIKAYNTIDFTETKAALATIARVEGSSYRRAGARMLVLDNGNYTGGISGGCLEGDALRRAQKAILQNQSSLVTYDTTQDDAHQVGVGLGCNGIIDVLFTPLHPQDQNNPVKLLSTIIRTRIPIVVVTITECPAQPFALGRTIVYEDERQFIQSFPLREFADSILPEIKNCLKGRNSQTISFSSGNQIIKTFIEVILPVTQLVLYGGGHDIYPLMRMAGELDWEVSVVTNIHKATKHLFAETARIFDYKSEQQPDIDDFTAVILMAHDYKKDLINLKQSLSTKAKYIGLLGSRKRGEQIFDDLLKEGFPLPESDLNRLFTPSGLDIGASTPEEIALSILAEIKAEFAGREGMSLRFRNGTIYGN